MNKYYLTFGQNHPLRDNYIVVMATNDKKAREAVINTFGLKWAFIYDNEDEVLNSFPIGNVLMGE